MKKEQKTTSVKGYGGLSFLTVIDIPIRETGAGSVYDIKPADLERGIAKYILQSTTPIRGAEVKYLRKVLGKSMEEFAREFNLSSAAIFKWEKDPAKYIGSINESAIRKVVGERLNIEVAATLRGLMATMHQPEEVVLSAADDFKRVFEVAVPSRSSKRPALRPSAQRHMKL